MKKLLVAALLVGAVYLLVSQMIIPFMDAQNLNARYSEAALAAKVFASENAVLHDKLGVPLKVGAHRVVSVDGETVTLEQQLDGGRADALAVSRVAYRDAAWKVVSYRVSYPGEAEPVELAR